MEFNKQPEPIKNDFPESWEVVINDMNAIQKGLQGNTDEDLVFNSDVINSIYGFNVFILKTLLHIKKGNKLLDMEPEDLDDSVSEIVELAKARNKFGKEKYGTALQPFNGRNSLEDAIEEALDFLVYFRTFVFEQIYMDEVHKGSVN